MLGNTIAAETGGSERLRVKSDGDVYIGNTAHSNDDGAAIESYINTYRYF